MRAVDMCQSDAAGDAVRMRLVPPSGVTTGGAKTGGRNCGDCEPSLGSRYSGYSLRTSVADRVWLKESRLRLIAFDAIRKVEVGTSGGTSRISEWKEPTSNFLGVSPQGQKERRHQK